MQLNHLILPFYQIIVTILLGKGEENIFEKCEKPNTKDEIV